METVEAFYGQDVLTLSQGERVATKYSALLEALRTEFPTL